MPSQRRWAVKEKIDQVILKVEKSRDELVSTAQPYAEAHKEYFDLFMTLAAHLDKAVEPLKALREII